MINKDKKFTDKVALVGGGSQGIGQQIALELAREGARVAIVSANRHEQAQAVAEQCRIMGCEALALKADLKNAEAVDTTVAQVCQQWGRLDILVNNVGGGGVRKPLYDISEEEWEAAFAINMKTTFLCTRAAARRFIEQGGGGNVVNIAAASGHRNFSGYGGYGPSKAAVINFTQQAAVELAPHGIRVNGVSPGAIRDPGTGWETREPLLVREVRRLPLARPGTRREIARTVVFLASEDSSYITGQMIVVDGGGLNTWYLNAAE